MIKVPESVWFAAAESGDLATLAASVPPLRHMDASDADGDTALIIAARCNQLETVKLLLKRKADPRVQNELGCTALHAAARNGHLEVARLFIGNCSVMNACDNAGHTALHDSVWNCHDSVARLLVEAGASTLTTNKTGDTPLTTALKLGDPAFASMLELLREASIAEASRVTARRWLLLRWGVVLLFVVLGAILAAGQWSSTTPSKGVSHHAGVQLAALYPDFAHEIHGLHSLLRNFCDGAPPNDVLLGQAGSVRCQSCTVEMELSYLRLRATKPRVVWEISPMHGYTTLMILSALDANNNSAQLHSFDIHDTSAKLITSSRFPSLHRLWTFHLGDVRSAATRLSGETSLGASRPEYLFLDSAHTRQMGHWYIDTLLPSAQQNHVHVSLHDVYNPRFWSDDSPKRNLTIQPAEVPSLEGTIVLDWLAFSHLSDACCLFTASPVKRGNENNLAAILAHRSKAGLVHNILNDNLPQDPRLCRDVTIRLSSLSSDAHAHAWSRTNAHAARSVQWRARRRRRVCQCRRLGQRIQMRQCHTSRQRRRVRKRQGIRGRQRIGQGRGAHQQRRVPLRL